MKTESSRGRHLKEPATKEEKRAFRLETVREVGTWAADICSAQMQMRPPGTRDRVVFSKTLVPKMMARYWALVDWFKADQNFEADVLINSPKKAALTVYAAVMTDGLFTVDPAGADESHAEFALALFCTGIMDAFMDVKDKDIHARHVRDIAVVIKYMRKSAHATLGRNEKRVRLLTMCLYMDTYWTNRGRNDRLETHD